LFAYDSDSQLPQARARYAYDLSEFTHSADASFTVENHHLQVSGGTFKLVATKAEATKVTFHASPIEVSIPADFTPDATPYRPNGRVAIKDLVRISQADMEGPKGKIFEGLSQTYAPQVAAVGDDADTAQAAAQMPDAIESTLAAEGAASTQTPAARRRTPSSTTPAPRASAWPSQHHRYAGKP
jgi:hypothetical protein